MIVPFRTPPANRPPPPRLASVNRLPLAGTDDATLARAILDGHPAAPSALWDRFAPLVRAILRRALGPGHDVTDLVQEAFLGFFRSVADLRDPGALRPFLIGITVHVARSELRRRRVRRFLHLTDSGVLPERAAGEDDPEAREALGRLYGILDQLDGSSRLAFVLRHIEELELTEVAAALGWSLATTKRRLAKVTARILAMVEHDPVLARYATAGQRSDHAP